MRNSMLKILQIGGLLLSLGISGCALSIGGGDTDIVHHETLGKELLDLKAAKDRGTLSDLEYEQARMKLIMEAMPEGGKK